MQFRKMLCLTLLGLHVIVLPLLSDASVEKL